MSSISLAGNWVLVTGASSGLGREIAWQLAITQKANIIAVARRKQQLEELKQQLETAAGVKVDIVCADLGNKADITNLLNELKQYKTLTAAVLNAGITHFGTHASLDWDKFEKMISLNISGVVQLSTGITAQFKEQKIQGGILLVSSMAALLPVPYQAAYSGTKGFLYNYGCALSAELKGTGISITILLPGGIETEMTATDQFDALKGWMMPAPKVAGNAIAALKKRKLVSVPGFSNKMGALFSGILPRGIFLSGMAATYKKALKL